MKASTNVFPGKLGGALLILGVSMAAASCAPSEFSKDQTPPTRASADHNKTGSKKPTDTTTNTDTTNTDTTNTDTTNTNTTNTNTTNTDTTNTNTNTNTNTSTNTPPAVNGNAECYKADAFICKIERLITDKTNKYRATQGKKSLTHDPKLSFVARDWSTKMGRSGGISHRGFPDARENIYRTEFRVARSMSAENVAYTGGRFSSSSQSDAAAEAIAEAFAVMWWESWGHRMNMLGRYTNIGVGISQSNSSWYATQIFD